jgi:putative tRNA adenosine deaminase-associated protein
MLARTEIPANANGMKLPCRPEYAPFPHQYAGSAAVVRDGEVRPTPTQLRPTSLASSPGGLIGDSAAAAGSYLTAFLRAEHAGEVMMSEGETDFAVIVYREEDQWEADALPAAVTADLDGLVHALRQQPSIGGTIGFAGVGDDFWLAVRVIGEDVSLFLSDLTAAVDYPLARQVLEALDIAVPSDDELDQVLPAGDLSIFADLGLEEMELGAIAADLDLYPEDAVAGIAERLRFGEAVEQALDRALGP